MAPEHAELLKLPPSERLELVEELWDSLAATPNAIPVHAWQIAEVERRDQEMQEHPNRMLTTEQLDELVRK